MRNMLLTPLPGAPPQGGRGTRKLSATALAAVALLVASGASGTETRDAALDHAIQAGMAQANIPGAIVGIWQEGEAPYVRAFGVCDKVSGEKMAADLYFRIGSLTKTFTITALLQLVDQGKIGLDDPIGKYVPGVPRGDEITLRQLAGMRSGLYSYTDDIIRSSATTLNARGRRRNCSPSASAIRCCSSRVPNSTIPTPTPFCSVS